jgi:hypothetical protein
MDNVYAQKKTVNGKVMLPQMYGDPRGHKETGREEWYHWTSNLHMDRLTEIYVWSMDRKDLERIPVEDWIGFLEGKNADYPEKAFRADLEQVRRKARNAIEDDTTPDTRLADYVMGLNPAATAALTKLTMGAYLTGNIWSLHARVRYFDPAQARPGLPDDVAALVEKMDAESVTLSLVNTSQSIPRRVIVQAGGYAEHQITSIDGRPMDASWIGVKLAPGAGGRITLKMKRYANEPTLRLPWER